MGGTAPERLGQHREGQTYRLRVFPPRSWLRRVPFHLCLPLSPFFSNIYLLLKVCVPAYPPEGSHVAQLSLTLLGPQLLFAVHFGVLTGLETEADSETGSEYKSFIWIVLPGNSGKGLGK